MKWIKDFPGHRGYYWYYEYPYQPTVVKVDEDGDVLYTGDEVPHGLHELRKGVWSATEIPLPEGK